MMNYKKTVEQGLKLKAESRRMATISAIAISDNQCLQCLQRRAALHVAHLLSSALPNAPILSPPQSHTPSLAADMFGALNRFIGLDAEPTRQARAQSTSDNSFGFQVLRNKDAELPLEPWFDFIVGINGRLIVRHFTLQADLLTCAGSTN